MHLLLKPEKSEVKLNRLEATQWSGWEVSVVGYDIAFRRNNSHKQRILDWDKFI